MDQRGSIRRDERPEELSGGKETRRAAKKERGYQPSTDEDKGEPAKRSHGLKRRGDRTETKGDRRRGSRGSQKDRHRSARTKGIKGGDRESKAKSKGQYGPRPGVGGVTLPEANQRGDCVVSE